MDILIGGEQYRNTDGTIEVEGVPQIEFVLKGPNGPLLVNFVVFDENGKLIAKLVNSSMAFNEMRAHALAQTATSVMLTEEKSGKVVLHAELKEPDRVVVRKAQFVTPRGRLLEVSAVDWRIGTNSKSSEADRDLNGGSVAIG